MIKIKKVREKEKDIEENSGKVRRSDKRIRVEIGKDEWMNVERIKKMILNIIKKKVKMILRKKIEEIRMGGKKKEVIGVKMEIGEKEKIIRKGIEKERMVVLRKVIEDRGCREKIDRDEVKKMDKIVREGIEGRMEILKK